MLCIQPNVVDDLKGGSHVMTSATSYPHEICRIMRPNFRGSHVYDQPNNINHIYSNVPPQSYVEYSSPPAGSDGIRVLPVSPSVRRRRARLHRTHSLSDTSARRHESQDYKIQPSSEDRSKDRDCARTWSPSATHYVNSNVGKGVLTKKFLSDEHLDADTDNGYAELELFQPAKLLPVSGCLSNIKDPSSIVKPIPFRPVVFPNNYYISTPKKDSPSLFSAISGGSPNNCSPLLKSGQSPQTRSTSSSGRSNSYVPDDGYLSRECSYQISPHCAPHHVTDQTDPILTGRKSSESLPKYQGQTSRCSRTEAGELSRVNSKASQPSSSSGVSSAGASLPELEEMLHSKTLELERLRTTMEHNEIAILQVMEEKKQNWEMEFREVVDDCEERLKRQTEKSSRTEHSLMAQIIKLQQENKSMRGRLDQLMSENDNLSGTVSQQSDDLEAGKEALDKIRWSLNQKVGEVGYMKSQLKATKDEVLAKIGELVQARKELKQRDEECEGHRAEIQRLLSDINANAAELQEHREECTSTDSKEHVTVQEKISQSRYILQLEGELREARETIQSNEENFQKEREKWLEEKSKVINYQKHLQLNYHQMTRKNKLLENEIHQLTLELESHDSSADKSESLC